MRAPLLLLALALCSVACDDPKDKAAAPDAAPAVTAVIPSAITPPSAAASAAPPAKKKVWKCAPGTSVDFEGDDALDKEVHLKLQKPPGAVIAMSELASIKSINLTKYGPIDELNPCLFPKFTGLHDLFVGSGALEDLKPIATLNQMITLRATDNRVSDLKPISSFGHLDRLDLSRTQVKDLEPLKAMVELTEISLDNTNVDDITPLGALPKLEKVTLANTPIKDVMALKGAKKLKLLDITGTQVSDPTGMLSPGVHVKN